jgi:hypothetical protein
MQDPIIIEEMQTRIEQYKNSLEKIYYCLKKHPEVFTNKKIVNLEFMMRLEACVDTRIFGTSRLRNSAMIPFCDAINHSHVRNSN